MVYPELRSSCILVINISNDESIKKIFEITGYFVSLHFEPSNEVMVHFENVWSRGMNFVNI